jgi:hypothetical protein
LVRNGLLINMARMYVRVITRMNLVSQRSDKRVEVSISFKHGIYPSFTFTVLKWKLKSWYKF